MSCSLQTSQLFKSLECQKLFFALPNDKSTEENDYSKETLLIRLKNKLLKRNEYCMNDENNAISDIVVNQGIYSEIVVSKLLKNGTSKEAIVKVMKRGLLNIWPDELYPFKIFNVTPEVLNNKCDLYANIDQELISKLKLAGVDEKECFDIILDGLINQNKCCLFKLSVSGIAINRILNWQGPIIDASDKIIKYLQDLGIEKSVCNIISKNGISEEAVEVLHDLGYSEMCILVENDKIIDSDDGISLKSSDDSYWTSYSSSINIKNLTETQEEILEKSNYLKDHIMTPLIWALNKTLQFRPEDPIHYIACQLLRWKYYLHSSDHNNFKNYVFDSKTKKDKLYDKKRFEDSEIISCICPVAIEPDKVMKCWEINNKYSTCEFPQFCSSCKLSSYENFEDYSDSTYNFSAQYLTNISNQSEKSAQINYTNF